MAKNTESIAKLSAAASSAAFALRTRLTRSCATGSVFYLILIFGLIRTLPCHAVEVNATLDRRTAAVGESVALTLTAAGRELPRLSDQRSIENMRWLGGSRTSVSIVNNRAEASATYYFQPLAEGLLEIPPLDVIVGRKTVKTPLLALQVVKGDAVKISSGDDEARQPLAIADAVFGRGRILTDGTEFYVGEEIPLEMKIYYPRDLNLEPAGWPEIEPENIIFKDYGPLGARNNPRFEPPTRNFEQVDGRPFNVYRFRTAFRCIAPGVLRPTATIATEIRVPERRQRGGSLFDSDDFFSGFLGRSRYRTIAHPVGIEFPELTIRELPPPPKHADFLGLVGNWRVAFSIADEQFRVGEPFSLKMEINGIGTLDTLNVPRLEVEGFRVYPPEINREPPASGENRRATVNYVLIPTRPGNAAIKLDVAIFSTPFRRYQEFGFGKEIEIGDSPFHTGGTVSVHTPATSDATIGAGRDRLDKEQPRSGILYLKTRPSGGVATPLYRNWLLLFILLGAGGPLAWLAGEFVSRRNLLLSNNTALRRRKAALAGRARVVKAIHRASPEEMTPVMQNEVVPYLNDMLNLPPGTDAATLAGNVRDSDLAECLKRAGESSYMPNRTTEHKPASKKRIIKSLKRVGAITLAACFPFFAEASPDNLQEKAPIETFADALNAYDRGDFLSAANYFRRQINAEYPDPALLFNLGNSLCQMEDYPRALVCFERARLLAPTDSAITENLNFVRRKLFLPEVGTVRHPGDLLLVFRDLLRPDQWLLLAVAAWFAAGVVLAFRHRLASVKVVVSSAVCGLILTLSVVAYITQKNGNYSSDRAIVVVENAELRSLPSCASGRVGMKLRGGTPVQIIEPRMEWVRIKINGHEGWVNCADIIGVAPGGRIP